MGSSTSSPAVGTGGSVPAKVPSSSTPPGLKNEGNTCFLNAALQAVSACPPFLHFLKQLVLLNAPSIAFTSTGATGLPEDDDSAALLVLRLAALVSELGSFSVQGSAPVSLSRRLPAEPMAAIADGQQQDAHEALFSTLMCVLSDQQQYHMLVQEAAQFKAAVAHMLRRAPAPTAPSSPGDGTDSASDAGSVTSSTGWRGETWGGRPSRALARAMRSRKGVALPTVPAVGVSAPASAAAAAFQRVSRATNPFTGWLLQRIRPRGCVPGCSASFVASPEPFQCLSLSLPHSAVAGVSLEGLLAAHFAPNPIPDWKCTCGGRGCLRTTALARAPPLLAVHVQRANTLTGLPDQRHVVFGEHLTLERGWMPTGACVHGYTLVSVVQHLGVSGAGHYVAFRRRPREPAALHAPAPGSEWLLMNDAAVQEVPLSTVLRAPAYMLFYIRDDCLRPGRGQAVYNAVAVPSPAAWAAVQKALAGRAGASQGQLAGEGGKAPVTLGGALEVHLQRLLGLSQNEVSGKGVPVESAEVEVPGAAEGNKVFSILAHRDPPPGTGAAAQ